MMTICSQSFYAKILYIFNEKCGPISMNYSACLTGQKIMALTGSHSNGNQRSVCVLVAKPAAILDSGQFFKINEVDVSVSLDIHS